MKTSYNEACARDCSTLEKDLALCEKAGFDYIEIRLDLLRGWLKEHTVEQLKEFFETHRLKPHAINAVYLHQGMLPDETPDWDDPAMQDFKLACEVGSAIGSGYVIIVPPLDPSGVFTGDVAAAEQECIRILKKLSALARPYGMKLCFELVGLRKSCVRSTSRPPTASCGPWTRTTQASCSIPTTSTSTVTATISAPSKTCSPKRSLPST